MSLWVISSRAILQLVDKRLSQRAATATGRVLARARARCREQCQPTVERPRGPALILLARTSQAQILNSHEILTCIGNM